MRSAWPLLILWPSPRNSPKGGWNNARELAIKIKVAAFRFRPNRRFNSLLLTPPRPAAEGVSHRGPGPPRTICHRYINGGTKCPCLTLVRKFPLTSPLPSHCPALPEGFTWNVRSAIERRSPMHVSEALSVTACARTSVFFCPGNRHITFGAFPRETCRARDQAPVNGHRPSVETCCFAPCQGTR